MENSEMHKRIGWASVGRYINKTYILVNFIANFCGALFVTLYFAFFESLSILNKNTMDQFYISAIIFIFLVIISMVVRRKWFNGIDIYIKLKSESRYIDSDLLKATQKSILNLPFNSSMISMINWGIASAIMSSLVFINVRSSDISSEIWFYTLRLFAEIIIAGIATSALVFFLMESYCRKVIPFFFPKGGLYKIKGIFSLNLRTRIMITFVFASFIPIIDFAMLSYSKAKNMMGSEHPETVLSEFGYLIIFVLFIDLSLAIILSHLLSKGIVRPVTEIKNAMGLVRKGNLSTFIRVSDYNELGILADNFNEMTEGLKDRYHIKQSLALAREVQQDLLPGKAPMIEELDIAGKIIYSDETGGDYYDYIYPNNPNDRKIGIVIGDVSEHRISSALLMASTRAFVRQRAALPGSIADIMTDVNMQFSRAVEDSGRFMTLFFLSVEYGNNCLEWVRAGHEPAILYNPLADSFSELKGKGIALGIDGGFQYSRYEQKDFYKGQIVILATDGLWESINSNGEMFGKERLHKIIADNCNLSAKKIVDCIIKSVEVYTASKIPDDDITLVIIKALPGK